MRWTRATVVVFLLLLAGIFAALAKGSGARHAGRRLGTLGEETAARSQESAASTAAEQPRARREAGTGVTSSDGQAQKATTDLELDCLVRERGGGPIAGARVSFAGRFGHTHEQGRVRLGAPANLWLGRGFTLSLSVTHPLFRDRSVSVSAFKELMVVELEGRGRISGRVVFPDGRPAAGVKVWVYPEWARTGEDGRYTIGGLGEGEVEVSIETCRVFPTRVRVRVGDTDVDLVAEWSLVRVRAVDDAGNPMFHAVHGVGAKETWSSGHGDGDPFSVLPVPPGRDFRVIVRQDGFVPVRVDRWPRTSHPMQHEVRAVLRRAPPTQLPVRVLDADGVPVVQVFIKTRVDQTESWRMRPLDLVNGRGTLRWVAPGEYLLRVGAAGRNLLWRELRLRIRAGHNPPREWRLPRGVRLRVRWVEVTSGKSLRVQHMEQRDIHTRFEQSDFEAGLWTAKQLLPPGRYRLQVKKNDKTLREGVVVLRHAPVTVDLTGEAPIAVGHSSSGG